VGAPPDLGGEQPVEVLDAFCNPNSYGGAKTGVTPSWRQNRMTRPKMSARVWAPWKRVSLSNCA